jgi:beta-phosphoglucomutase
MPPISLLIKPASGSDKERRRFMKQAVIFDLDGVIVSTDEYHYQAWKKMAKEEEIYFDRRINERLRGVSRMESLKVILEKSKKFYTKEQKTELAERKNSYYKDSLHGLTPKDILPGVMNLLDFLDRRNIKKAIGSSSKNTRLILKQIDLESQFDAIADGNGITKSKPDPEVFLLAAKLLERNPSECVVIEDALAGIDAAKAAGCKAVGIGSAKAYEKVDYGAQDVDEIDLAKLLN